MTPAEVTDAEVERFRAELERSLSRLEGYLREQLRLRAKGEKISVFSAEVARQTLDRLLADYERMFGRASDAVRAISGRVLAAVGDELEGLGISAATTQASQTTLLLQLGRGLDDLETLRTNAGTSLREVVTESLRTSVNPREAFDRLAGELGKTAAQVVSLVDTTTMGVDRVAVVEQSLGAGIELFLFDGPLDGLTRPWCAERVGKTFTRAEMDEVLNDTGPQPPSAYGGGWNCRHRFVPVDPLDAAQYPRWQGRALPGADAARLPA